jgi:hypothetical protein
MELAEHGFINGRREGIDRIYHQVACDCFSSFGAAKVYNNKITDASTLNKSGLYE